MEVLSLGNTRAEMTRKLSEYFAAGVRLVWLVDLDARSVMVHRPDGSVLEVGSSGALDGGDVLPGLSLALGDVFGELDRVG